MEGIIELPFTGSLTFSEEILYSMFKKYGIFRDDTSIFVPNIIILGVTYPDIDTKIITQLFKVNDILREEDFIYFKQNMPVIVIYDEYTEISFDSINDFLDELKNNKQLLANANVVIPDSTCEYEPIDLELIKLKM